MIFPFSALVPTAERLAQSVRAAFVANLDGSDAWIPLNNISPTAKVIGGALWQVYGRLAFVAQQIFAGTAVGKYLEMHGADLNMPRRGAVLAAGLGDVTVTAAATFPAGTQFQRGDGFVYASNAPLVFSGGGTQPVSLTATTAAAAGDAIAGTSLAILAAPDAIPTGPGVATAEAVVDSATPITGGLDVEQDGAFWTTDLSFYRGRILFRKRNPPQGGSPADYVQWATSIPGVTRVYVERLYAGPGTVRIFPFFDGIFLIAGGVPDSGHIAAVTAAIGISAPAEAAFAVQAATPLPIDVTISNLVPNTTAMQNAIVAELQAMFIRRGRPNGIDSGAGGMSFLATPTDFDVAWIAQAVMDTPGIQGADVSPTSDQTLSVAQTPVLGTVIWA